MVLFEFCSFIIIGLTLLYTHVNSLFSDFTKMRIMYVLGTFQLVFTPFVLAYNINMAKYLHVLKFIILIPLRFLDFKQRKWHYYMVEFCYYSGLLLNLFIIQERLLNGQFDKYFITIYTFATGPVQFAIYPNNDRLFLHSLSHLTTTYIHVSPALMVWGLRWHNTSDNLNKLYPVDFTVNGVINSYIDMLKITVPIYMIWAIVYYIYMFILSWDRNYKKDNKTLYRQITETKASPFKKVHETYHQNQYFVGCLYIGGHILWSLVTGFLAMMMFNNYYLNTLMVIISFWTINWKGSYKLINAIMYYEEHRKSDNKIPPLPKKIESKPEIIDLEIIKNQYIKPVEIR